MFFQQEKELIPACGRQVSGFYPWKTGYTQAAVDYVKSTWETVNPNYPFDYRFVEQDLDRMYRSWEGLSTLLKYFTVLAIFIACLGLFGLASFPAEQRTKELGVRKVLGASVTGLALLMSKEFAKWVLIANLIDFPIAYIVMNN
jgi:putative ABC transport system permease protein